MDFSHFLLGGGIIAALLPRLQMLASGILGLLIERRDFHYENAEPVMAWLASLPSVPFGAQELQTVHQRKGGRSSLVFCRNNNRPGLFIFRGRAFWVRIDRREGSGWPQLYWIRGTYGRNQLPSAAVHYYNGILTGYRGRFGVYRRAGVGSVHARMGQNNNTIGTCSPCMPGSSDKSPEYRVRCGLITPINGEPIEFPPPPRLFFPAELESVVAEIGQTIASEQWFRSRALPWRRGYLFHGKPGTGKTSMAVHIAHEHDLPVFAFDLASMSNKEFYEAWQDAATQTPCIALLEDFDRVFEGSTNLAGEAGGGLTLDAILNALSGAQPADGIFLIITANDPSKLDTAMSNGNNTRPGRIDRAIEFGSMQDGCRKRMAEQMLDGLTDDARDAVVAAGEGETAAQFQERCIQSALYKPEPKC